MQLKKTNKIKQVQFDVLTVNVVCEGALSYESESIFQKRPLPLSLRVGIFLREYTASSNNTAAIMCTCVLNIYNNYGATHY